MHAGYEAAEAGSSPREGERGLLTVRPPPPKRGAMAVVREAKVSADAGPDSRVGLVNAFRMLLA